MNLLMLKNESSININVATFNQNKLGKCFNRLAPGTVINIECAETDGQDFIVMASDGNQEITTHDNFYDVLSRSLDSAYKNGVLTSKFKRRNFGETQETLFASIY